MCQEEVALSICHCPLRLHCYMQMGDLEGSPNTAAFAFLQTEAVVPERTEEGSEWKTLQGRDRVILTALDC